MWCCMTLIFSIDATSGTPSFILQACIYKIIRQFVISRDKSDVVRDLNKTYRSQDPIAGPDFF